MKFLRRRKKKRVCKSFENFGSRSSLCNGYIDNGNRLYCSHCHYLISRKDAGDHPNNVYVYGYDALDEVDFVGEIV